MLRLWVDTDIGDNPDDAVALLVAAAHPGIRLVGISTVGGDVVERTETARQLFAAANAPLPLVYAGTPDPRAIAVADAVLAIGPLGNLAALVRAGVTLPPVVAMGGVLAPTHHRGEIRNIDTNFGSDPLAAAIVVAEVPDLLVVPLDVTAAMTVDERNADRLASVAALRPHLDRWATTGAPICLHDPLALLAVVGEGVQVGRQALAVTVEGRLVVDDHDGVDRDVVIGVDRAGAMARIVELVMEWGD